MNGEPRTIALRAHARPSGAHFRRIAERLGASRFSLVFDNETWTDAAQQLRFGTYMFMEGLVRREAGIFYDPASVRDRELALIRRYGAKHDLEVITRDEFVDRVFFALAYRLNAQIVAFNLPFDISRLAVDHGNARARMRGGFSFQLSTDRYFPNVVVRHLSSRSALIRFNGPVGQNTPRSKRKGGQRVKVRRGHFVDVRTLAAAMTSEGHSLGSLTELLGVSRKHEMDDYSGPVTNRFLDYAMADVRSTWECYLELVRRYAAYGLSTPVSAIYSEASVGKACLHQMDVAPWRGVQDDFPAWLTGAICSSYYGGRSEVAIRREVTRVAYLDFLSMYPSVCTLMGLWRYVISTGVNHSDATEEIRELLSEVSPGDPFDPSFWTQLPVLVRLRPDEDLFPVRSRYGGDSLTIGLNYLTSSKPMWFTLAEVIVSKILTGKTPTVIEAIRFTPREPQEGLAPLTLPGGHEIDPYSDDFYRRLIELRLEIKEQLAAAEKRGDSEEASRSDATQLALKIMANATSYGIFIELNVRELAERKRVVCYGGQRRGFSREMRQIEEEGSYFHPLLATLITGAARLMLAMAEREVLEEGLDWCLCDTDSMAIAKPKAMGEREFRERVDRVRHAFDALSPYEGKPALFKMEKENYSLDGKRLVPLHAFAISAKRYVLFNQGTQSVIRKASAHGLGHLRAPYKEKDSPTDIPAPAVKLSKIGVARWQYDLWYRILQAASSAHPERVNLYLPGFDEPAVSRYAATTPRLLSWFKRHNADKDYREQVRPFNFMLAFQADPLAATEEPPRAVAAFDKNISKAAKTAFDRESGDPVSAAELRSYLRALAQYHLHPESKFEGGDFLESGRVSRRHIRVSGIEYIGKEANRWEEQAVLGEDESAQISYGRGLASDQPTKAELLAWRRVGVRELARRSGVSAGEVSRVVAGGQVRTSTTEKIRAVACDPRPCEHRPSI